MFGLGRALLRSGLRQRLLRGDRTGPRLPRVLRDIPGVQRDQHVTSANPVSGLDAYAGNRCDDSTRDGCGFPCGDNAAGFEPLGRVDRRHRSDGDRDRLSCLRLWPVLAPAAGGQTTRHNTERDDSNQSIHDHHVLGSEGTLLRAARARDRAPRSGESRPFRRLWPATLPPAPPRRLAARRSLWPARPRTDRG